MHREVPEQRHTAKYKLLQMEKTIFLLTVVVLTEICLYCKTEKDIIKGMVKLTEAVKLLIKYITLPRPASCTSNFI